MSVGEYARAYASSVVKRGRGIAGAALRIHLLVIAITLMSEHVGHLLFYINKTVDVYWGQAT